MARNLLTKNTGVITVPVSPAVTKVENGEPIRVGLIYATRNTTLLNTAQVIFQDNLGNELWRISPVHGGATVNDHHWFLSTIPFLADKGLQVTSSGSAGELEVTIFYRPGV